MPKVIQLLLNANRFREFQAFGSAIATSRRINNTGLLALASLILLLGATIFPIAGSARQAVEAITSTATESSLTFTSINPTASVSLSVSDPSGTFASSTDSQIAKFSISTTNYTGYTVTIKYSNGNTLSNGTNTLAALGETVTPANFALATNTKYNNKWGILPNYCNSAANTSYISMPASGSITLDETSAANTTAKEYTIGLGVRADYTYAESTFYNTFVIEYVANPINYAITYDGNAPSGKTVSNMPTSPQSGNTAATSITLATAKPEAENHEFKGWCTVKMAVNADCSGTTYQPGATYGIDQTANNSIILYAMWKSTSKTLAQATYLQDKIDCTNSASGAVYALTDNRDNEVYSVAKLADGKCWLLDNLRLDPAAMTLTSSNTNVTSTVTTTFTSKTSGWSGNVAYTAAWYNLGSKTSTQSYGSGSSNIGGYYNYCAASAGTYCMNYSSGSGNTTQDLCPVGWRMPTGGAGGEYEQLYNTYGAYSALREASHLILSGFFWDYQATSQGSAGIFWSSTVFDGSDMYAPRLLGPLLGSRFESEHYHVRSDGISIRCVLK